MVIMERTSTRHKMFNASFFSAPLIALSILEITLWVVTDLLHIYQSGTASLLMTVAYVGKVIALLPWTLFYYVLASFYLGVAWRVQPLEQDQKLSLAARTAILLFYAGSCIWWNLTGEA